MSEVQIAPLRRGERNNALLTVRICANGQPYDLTGKTASLVATTAAGKLVGPCPMEVAEAGAARIMLPAALYSAVGVFSGYVEIRDGEALVDTTDRFGGKVLECADLDAEQAAEFTPVLRDMEQAVADAKRATIEANEAASHQPRIGKSDTWEVWDITTDQYVDTGVAARGTQGIQGEPGPKGDQGPAGAKGDPGEPGSDAAATDVRMAGKSITADTVADIPAAVNNGSYGVVKAGAPELGGIQINANGNISNIAATNAQIDAHAGWFQPIVPSNLDYAVKAAMCDGKGAAWTAAEQAAARERMGLGNSPRQVLIPATYDDEGNVLSEARIELQDVEVPNMVAITRDMTPEEEAEARAFEASMPEPQPTIDERVETLKSSTDELADTVLALCDLIEGGE